MAKAEKRDFYEEGVNAALAGHSDTPPDDVTAGGLAAEACWVEGYKSKDEGEVDEEHVTDGSPCPCGPTTVTVGGFEILPEEEESRPAPPARGKYPRLLGSLLKAGLAPGKPAMSIRVPEGEEPLLVAEGLKREGRRVGQQQGMFWGEPARWGQYYIEAWVHPTKEGVVQVKAREGVAPYTKKPKGEGT